jgi:hypothetical protein
MRWIHRFLTGARGARSARTYRSQSLRARPAFELLEDRCTPATYSNVNEAYIGQVYQSMLLRAVDSSGLSTWGGYLAGGGNQAMAAYAIETAAPQHEFWVTEVELNYKTLLRREADSTGLTGFVNSLATGGTIEQMQAAILGSQEYFQTQGGGTNQGFLTALYRDLLARDVDAAGQSLYGGALSAGVSRQQVAGIILASTEYRTDLVRSYYQQYLHRAPQPDEVSGFRNTLAGGGRLEMVLAVVIGSQNGLALIPLAVTSVTSSSASSAAGAAVTFTATVAPVSTGAGTPTGTVTFEDGGTSLGTANLDANGTAVFTTSSLSPGTHTITASYGGDSVFTASSGSVTQTITASNTTTSVTGTPNPSVFGQSVTFTADVAATASGQGTPTGSVTFVDQTTNTTLGTGTLDASGQASISTSSLSVATHTIVATYAGESNFTSSNGSTTQTVNQASTTTTLGLQPNPSVFGQEVTLTATVQAAAPGVSTPTGTVTFVDQTNQTTLGTGTLDTSGHASITSTSLALSTNTIMASYGGDTNFATSQGGASQSVNPAATMTSLSSTPNPSNDGAQVTLTAKVTATAPGGGTPSGVVTFVDQTSTRTLGTANLDSNGQVSFPVSDLGPGTHTVVANYSGDSNFTASSGSTDQTVTNLVATALALSATPNPSTSGDQVTFTATVTTLVSGAGTPAGSVTFVDQTTGDTLGMADLDSSGKASINTSTLASGSHTIVANYAGNVTFALSSGTTTQVVS